MAGGVDQVDGVALPVNADVLGLDGDAPLPFDVHGVEVLVTHLAGADSSGELEDAVGQGRLAVVDVGHDRQVPDLVRRSGGGGERAHDVRGPSLAQRGPWPVPAAPGARPGLAGEAARRRLVDADTLRLRHAPAPTPCASVCDPARPPAPRCASPMCTRWDRVISGTSHLYISCRFWAGLEANARSFGSAFVRFVQIRAGAGHPPGRRPMGVPASGLQNSPRKDQGRARFRDPVTRSWPSSDRGGQDTPTLVSSGRYAHYRGCAGETASRGLAHCPQAPVSFW